MEALWNLVPVLVVYLVGVSSGVVANYTTRTLDRGWSLLRARRPALEALSAPAEWRVARMTVSDEALADMRFTISTNQKASLYYFVQVIGYSALAVLLYQGREGSWYGPWPSLVLLVASAYCMYQSVVLAFRVGELIHEEYEAVTRRGVWNEPAR